MDTKEGTVEVLYEVKITNSEKWTTVGYSLDVAA